ncbi:IMPACT family protein [Cyclobacterium jeungdonense]|uniref:YigZ family protein n=1 Tax=Cyclobacterium jeungdonense TaxID=708087 RepID=A0ABT8C8Z8_9BACT|nr:YigZ family protein [Cyclobacterium jeungdonense]MDN3688293.1 YigZ family protein [Cyclobacterium jeungdonense]
MEDTYLTLKTPTKGLYKEKGSKFLSFAYPVESEAEIQQILDELKKTYHDARHHCYAYILGRNKEVYRANDDGEPHHSAGDPILGQLRSRELTQSLVVVVRYFGGVKLGVGGLVRAYKTAAAEAIDAGEVIQKILVASIIIRFDYLSLDEVMHLIQRHDLKISDQQFDLHCQIRVECREKQADAVRKILSTIPSLEFLT